MEGNDIFTALSEPPKEALRAIAAGRLKGKTDINPQWRYKAMTAQFGLCGIGWKYTIDRQWLEEGTLGQKLAFVNVSFFVKVGDEWSDAIPGTGGSMMITNETKSVHDSDEAFKMATTDALSVAMKMIGVASAIYEGRWDGTKYADEQGDGMDFCEQLERSKTLEELQKNFTVAYNMSKGNVQAQKNIIATKDAMKKKMGADSGTAV